MTEENKTAAARKVRRQINTAMLQGNAVIADYMKKYGYTGDLEQNVQNMLSSLNGGKTAPIMQTALDTLPDAFKADAEEPYMKQSTALWQATGKDSTLPNPNTSFSVNETKYEIGSADWDNFTAKYKQAYVSYLAQNSAGWDGLSAEDQLEIMSKSHTAGTNAAKKWYMKLHQTK